MNKQVLLRHKYINYIQSLLMLLSMGLIFALLGWSIGGKNIMFWFAIVGISILLSGPATSPRIILKLYGSRKLTRQEAPQLYKLVRKLAKRAGLARAPRIHYIPSQIINAFTVGNSRGSAIALTDGLLRRLTLQELAGVLAHEISHIRNNDMWVMSLADFVTRLTRYLSIFGQILLVISFPIIYFTAMEMPWLVLLLLLTAPALSSLLQLALSRTRELHADLSAVEITRDPRGLASALSKLERYQGGLVRQILQTYRRNPNPSLLRTHPHTKERVKKLISLMDRPRTPAHAHTSNAKIFQFPNHIPVVTRAPSRHLNGIWR